MNLVSRPKEKTSRTLEKRLMIIICELTENEVTAGHRKLHIRDFINITGLVKSMARVMQHTHKINAHEILLVKPEGLRSFGRFGYIYIQTYTHTHTHTQCMYIHTRGDNIKIDIREIVRDYAK